MLIRGIFVGGLNKSIEKTDDQQRHETEDAVKLKNKRKNSKRDKDSCDDLLENSTSKKHKKGEELQIKESEICKGESLTEIKSNYNRTHDQLLDITEKTLHKKLRKNRRSIKNLIDEAEYVNDQNKFRNATEDNSMLEKTKAFMLTKKIKGSNNKMDSKKLYIKNKKHKKKHKNLIHNNSMLEQSDVFLPMGKQLENNNEIDKRKLCTTKKHKKKQENTIDDFVTKKTNSLMPVDRQTESNNEMDNAKGYTKRKKKHKNRIEENSILEIAEDFLPVKKQKESYNEMDNVKGYAKHKKNRIDDNSIVEITEVGIPVQKQKECNNEMVNAKSHTKHKKKHKNRTDNNSMLETTKNFIPIEQQKESINEIDGIKVCTKRKKHKKKQKSKIDDSVLEITNACIPVEKQKESNTEIDNAKSYTKHNKKHKNRIDNHPILEKNEASSVVKKYHQSNNEVYDVEMCTNESNNTNNEILQLDEYRDVSPHRDTLYQPICVIPGKKNTSLNDSMHKKVRKRNSTSGRYQVKKSLAEIDNENSDSIEGNSKKLIYSMKPSFNFDTSSLDFEEDSVDFCIPLLHKKESIHGLNKEETESLLSEGVVIKSGKYTKFEDELLRRNYTNFTSQFNVHNPLLLFGIGQQKRNDTVTKFLNMKHFYVRLGKDLNNRTLRSIYRRARRLFHPVKEKGQFNEDEIVELKKLHSKFGNKWERIGEELDRSSHNVYRAFKWQEYEVNHGRWSPEEEKSLINAVKTVTGTEDTSVLEPDGICWESVARMVRTRNADQCRFQWGYFTVSNTVTKQWDRQCFAKLVNFLERECNVVHDTQINWKKVQKAFSDVSPSYMFLQRKWRYLRTQVPDECKNNYRRMLDFLSRKYKRYDG